MVEPYSASRCHWGKSNMKVEAESYLKSGSNEVRILEYKVGGASFGINILKVNKIVSRLNMQITTPDSHPAVNGIFEDRGRVIPIIDLAGFLNLPADSSNRSSKIIITEFFELSNGFLVERVDWIHHFKWEDVIDAQGILGNLDHRYILGLVKPTEDHIILLLDYESIILELCPTLQRSEMSKAAKSDFSGEGYRILIAEDSPSVRAMLATELNEIGFKTIEVADGVEALNTLKLDPQGYAMVISDVEMPRMDGLALTVAIRDGEAKCDRDLPVIVYSSIGDMGMKKRAEFLRANAHVTKLNVDELLIRVRELVESQGIYEHQSIAATATTEDGRLNKLEPVAD